MTLLSQTMHHHLPILLQEPLHSLPDEELQQYDVISDDLANMKRLKQENEQLKKALVGVGGSVAVAEDAPAVVAKSLPQEERDDEAAVEEIAPRTEIEEQEEPVMAADEVAIPAEENSSKDDQTPEDLLSEFEKMLG